MMFQWFINTVSKTLGQILGLEIGDLVDEQIEEALVDVLTEQDFQVYEDYLKSHPGASEQEAIRTLLAQRKEILEHVQKSLGKRL